MLSMYSAKELNAGTEDETVKGPTGAAAVPTMSRGVGGEHPASKANPLVANGALPEDAFAVMVNPFTWMGTPKLPVPPPTWVHTTVVPPFNT